MIQRKNQGGVLTAIHGNILEALARFKYLTPKQFMKIGVGTSQITYLRKNLQYLRERRKPLISCHSFNFPDPKKGRIESLHFLKPHGKKACLEELFLEEDEIRMPIGNSIAYKDYFHRVTTIWFHIALWQWANSHGRNITLFDTYFDKTGNNRVSGNLRAKNRLTLANGEYLIPDATIILEHTDGNKELFLFEMHRGDDAGRAIRQIYKHCKAQYLGSPQTEYGLQQPYQILIIFEFERCMNATIKQAQTHPRLANMLEYFLCKTQDEILNSDFCEGWITLSGKRVELGI